MARACYFSSKVPVLLLSILIAFFSLVVSAVSLPENIEPVVLTTETYDEKTEGKTAFVFFFSPKCGKCKIMAPVWDEIAKTLASDPDVLVGAVDCNGAGVELCSREGITHLPVIKYGDPKDLQFHRGSGEFDALHEFAKKHVKGLCSPDPVRRENCDNDELAKIDRFESLSEDELDRLIEEAEGDIAGAHANFTEEATRLNELYAVLLEGKDKVKTEAVRNGLLLMRAVRSLKLDTNS